MWHAFHLFCGVQDLKSWSRNMWFKRSKWFDLCDGAREEQAHLSAQCLWGCILIVANPIPCKDLAWFTCAHTVSQHYPVSSGAVWIHSSVVCAMRENCCKIAFGIFLLCRPLLCFMGSIWHIPAIWSRYPNGGRKLLDAGCLAPTTNLLVRS